MGISIYYRGQLKSLNHLDPLINDLAERALLLGWGIRPVNDDWEEILYYEWFEIRESNEKNRFELKGNLGLKGVILMPPECSNFMVTVNAAGSFSGIESQMSLIDNSSFSDNDWLSVETQKAGSSTHIEIIKMLELTAGKYAGAFQVMDEGEYWEKRDSRILNRRLRECSASLRQFEKKLKRVRGRGYRSPTAEAFKRELNDLFK